MAQPECTISPHYTSIDPIPNTRGNNRMEAISRMRRSLDVTVVEGIRTNIPLHRRILRDPEFIRGNLDTGYLDRLLERKEAAALAS